MRQTLADRVVNTEFDIHQDTVILSIKNLRELYKHWHDSVLKNIPCTPIFEHMFIEWGIDNEKMGVYVQPIPSIDGYERIVCSFFATAKKNIHLCFEGISYLYVDSKSPRYAIPKTDYLISDLPFKLWDLSDIERISNGGVMLDILRLVHRKQEIELITPSRQVSRQIERKTGKKPSPYFEIKVDPSKPNKRYTSSRKSKRKHNAHMVRGHFATYGEDNKLFGKYTGTFFRPAHVRGESSGDVKPKDYRIVLPEVQS